jgi:hypothetical protein
MATSTAQNAPANSRSNASDKTNGAIKVVMPDANGDFTAAIAKGAIEKVQVVDVDMVLKLKDGTSVVLAGGAISAMDAGHTGVKFTDGEQGLANLLDQVGVISIPKLDPILSSLQEQPLENGQGNGATNADSPGGLTASVTTQIVNQLTQIVQVNAQSVTIKSDTSTQASAINTKTGDVDARPLQHVEPPLPPEKPGVIPQQHIIGPDAPAMTLSLVNLTTITQIGNVLYGSGGTPASATDSSNAAQFASQLITGNPTVDEIHAISNIPPNNFIKVINIALTGDGIAQSITIKGVPDGMSIANGTDLGGGNWSVAVVDGQRSYDIQLEYTTTPADPQAPIHQQFSLEFDVSMSTGDGVVDLAQVREFVVKDVNSANDLTYLDSSTGESVYVLPAQGNSHIIHAGNDNGVTIDGSNANDFLFGGAGADTLNGGSGNTYMEGGAGADHLNGGVGGINTAGYTLAASGVTVNLATGLGSGAGSDSDGDVLTNIQNVIGSAHDDTFVSGAGANNIQGGGHDAGGDTVSYAASDVAVIVDLSAGTGVGGYAAGDVLTGIQNVIGSAHNDTFFASSEANAFTGGGQDLNGADTVSYANDTSGTGVIVNLFTGQGGGAAAGDTYSDIQNIIGTGQSDTFIDGAGVAGNRYDGGIGGQDTISYANSSAGVNVNFVTERGTGGSAEGDSYVNIQNVIGSTHDDVFTAGIDSKTFDGGGQDPGGVDTVSYAGAASSVIIDTVNNVGHGAAEGNSYTDIQKFIGGGSSDTFIASAAHNWFDGGIAGSDTVDYSADTTGVTVDLFHTDGTGTSGGLAEGDILTNIANVIGGSGDDMFIANAAQNSFEGGGGVNTVSYQDSTSASGTGVTVDLSATDGSGTGGNFALGDKFSNIQNVIGSTFNDTFVASLAANTFTGGGGSDTVSYANSVSTDNIGVTVDLSGVNTPTGIGHGTGDYAQGDTYIGVQNAIGSAFNDTFIAGGLANTFTGDGGSDTVSYQNSAGAVTVDLDNGIGVGGDAQGDQYIGIDNVIGSAQDDTIIDSQAANVIDGGTGSLHNRVSYADSVSAPGIAAGVTVDLTATDGSGTFGGYAAGDQLSNIQDLTGSAADDTFVASAAENNLDGGASTAASHNEVSYAKSVDSHGVAAGVIVDLFNGTGSGGYANNDTYVNIQDVMGSLGDDTIIDSAAANTIDGNTGSVHNRVDYSHSVDSTGAAAGVTIDLNLDDGSGNSGGFAAGDKLSNIQDLTGSAADDIFVASAADNFLDGGISTVTSHNVVSYAKSVDDITGLAVGVTVDLANGTGTGGYADGDTYTNIQDVIGSGANDLFYASQASNNFDGGAGSDTVSYERDLTGNGVTVDLYQTGVATGGGYASGDTFTNIENVIGTTGNDIFIDGSGLVSNTYTGLTGSDTVDYSHSDAGVIVNLSSSTTAAGLAGNTGSGGFAAGDVYSGIENVNGSAFNDIFVGSSDHNIFTGGGGDDTVDYSTVAGGAAMIIDFSAVGLGGTGTGTGGLADGDSFIGIRNAIGGQFDDIFIADTDVNVNTSNSFDGGTGSLHNEVSYAGTGVGVIVNLATGVGSAGAIGDHYANIQDVLGTTSDDTIVASEAHNTIDGGTGSVHNRIDYSASVDDITGLAVGVTVDLANGTGIGGYADGDILTHIQDVTGSGANDLFYASGDNNNFDGGAGSDTVSYQRDLSGNGVTVDLYQTGVATARGYAAGDTFTNIENVIGTTGNDIFIDGSGLVSNTYTGLTGSDTVDYSHSGAGVTVNLSSLTTLAGLAGNSGSGGFAAGDVYSGIENVNGSAFNDTFYDGSGAAPDQYTGNGGVDTVNYSLANDGNGITVNFGTGFNTGTGSVGFAAGDTYIGIRSVVGTQYNDTFIASTDTTLATANAFNGFSGADDRVSYAGTATGVTVDLVAGTGQGGAAGDTYANIEDVTGTTAADVIYASQAANSIDGGGGNDTVNYSKSTSIDATGVTVDLSTVDGNVTGIGHGTGDFAQGDTYVRIQNAVGSSYNDTFKSGTLANFFSGGAGSDTVDYSASTAAVIVNLSSTTIGGVAGNSGSGGTGSYAVGDTYSSIENVTGSTFSDLFYAASGVSNAFNGGGGAGIDTVSYAASTTFVIADLSGGTIGGDATGDTYVGITNLTGGSGDDTLTGLTAGGSTLDGGVGNDTLNGSGGSNILLGGAGNDIMTVTGTGGNNTLTGGAGTDTMTASGNGNLFNGGTGGDTMSGAAGSTNNTAVYTNSGAGVTVDLVTGLGSGVGGDTTVSDAIGDHLSNIQNVLGTTFADTFVGNGSTNIFTGGGGIDTVSYFESASSVNASLAAAGAGGTLGDANGDTYVGITNLTGSNSDDILVGLTAGGSTLTGNAGNDTLTGTGGNNKLIGGSGNDLMTASGNNNTFIGGTGADNMSGAVGSSGNVADYSGSAAGVTVNLVTGLGSGVGSDTTVSDAIGDQLSNIQNLIGSAFDDTFYLNHGVNDVQGGAGSDTVNYSNEAAGTNLTIDLSTTIGTVIATGAGAVAFGGTDTLHSIENAVGGAGNDTFVANSSHNFFDGGAGSNTVSYASETGITGNVTGVTVDLHGNVGSGTLAGGADSWAVGDTYLNIQNVIGTTGNDTFIDRGDASLSSYNGNSGTGSTGSHDLVSYQYTNTGNPLVIGLDGMTGHNTNGDTYSHISDLTGSAFDNTTIWGDANNNILTALGTTNTNVLNGGTGGNDILDGRLGGHDTLNAGTGGTTIIEINTMAGIDNSSGTPLPTSVISSNIDSIHGSTSATTLDLHNLSANLDLSSFDGKVSGITTLDLRDVGDSDIGSGNGSTRASISSADINALGVHLNGNTYGELTIALDAGKDSFLIQPVTGQDEVVSDSLNGLTTDYTFIDHATQQTIAILHVLK